MLLDVFEVDGFRYPRLLKQVAGVFGKYRVVPDPVQVRFEV